MLEALPRRGGLVPGIRRGGVADMIMNEPPPPAVPSTHLGVGPIMLRLAGGRDPEAIAAAAWRTWIMNGSKVILQWIHHRLGSRNGSTSDIGGNHLACRDARPRPPQRIAV